MLVYGTGGVGKTTLVQHLVREGQGDEAPIIWVPRIDVDDSEYWLLSNLETAIAHAVDPGGSHFTAYFEHLSKLPQYADQRADYESVLTHLGRTNCLRITKPCREDSVPEAGTGETACGTRPYGASADRTRYRGDGLTGWDRRCA